MRKDAIWMGMLILLISIVHATSITENDITITSDKDTYFCEPVISNEGCLIVAKINVTNRRASAINLDGLSTFSNAVSQVTYLSSTGSVIPQFAQNKIPHELFLGGETKTYELRFFAEEDGKFNYTVNLFQLGNGNLIATTVLDPFYNVTIDPTSPTYLLQNGVCMNYSVFEFENQIEISSELSDGDENTHYHTWFASMPNLESNIIDGFAFNDYIFGDTIYSYTGGHNGEIFGSLDKVNYGDVYGDYFGAYFDGVNDYLRIPFGSDLDIPDLAQFSLCVVLNTTQNVVGDTGIIEKGLLADGIFMTYKNDETVDCEFDGTTGATTVSSTTVINDGLPHVICCRKNGDNIDIWVDGVQEDTGTANIGAVSNSNDMFVGSLDLGVGKFQGTIRQLGLFDVALNTANLTKMTATKSIAHLDKGQAIHMYVNHTITNDENNHNYIAIVSNADYINPIRLMSYINATHVNTTNYIDSVVSDGINYLSIDTLVETGYNAPYRVWSLDGSIAHSIEEVFLVTAINDTIPPNVTNCQVNTTSLECNEYVRFQCDVTDDAYLYQVWFLIDNAGTPELYLASTLAGDTYYYDKRVTGIYNETKQVVFSGVNATDLGLNYQAYSLNLTVNYTCLSECTPDWQQNIGLCLINDSRQITYTDNNNCDSISGLPADNGTWYICDYCSEDLVETTNACLWNGTGYYEEVSWSDNNYYLCCAITGIASDCTIETSPYNMTYSQMCNALIADFDVQLDDIVYFGFDVGGKDKVYGKVYINGSDEYSCVSYVKTPEGKLIQSNPVYEAVTNLAVLSKSYEDRDVFQTQNGLANVYWTKENLVVDGTLYVFGVECSSNSSHKISEKAVTVLYESVSSPVTRWFWFRDNMLYIGLGLILTIFLIVLASWIYKGAWKR